jgi:peptide/nickel transport system permease protein
MSTADNVVAGSAAGFAQRQPRAGFLFSSLRALRKQPLGMIGFAMTGILMVGAVVGPMLAPQAPDALVGGRLSPPGTDGFILGTDHIGRDELSRLLYGFRQTVTVTFTATALSISLAVMLGLIGGLGHPWVDSLLQRLVDAVMSFPSLILFISIVAIVGGGLIQLILTLGCLYAIGGSRVVRAAILSTKSAPYLESARVMGARMPRVILRYVLPNIFGTLMVIATLNLGAIVLLEAALSFIGLGISDPALPTWGRMLFESRSRLQQAPLLAVWPGLLISAAVFGFNMLGDALRDILDPRLRGSR